MKFYSQFNSRKRKKKKEFWIGYLNEAEPPLGTLEVDKESK
jgi:hypothetical protein